MAELIIEVTDEFAAAVAAAARERYPQVIRDAHPDGGETDAQAWRAVAAFWTADLMANRAADQVRAAAQQQITAAEQARDAAVQQAASRARAAVAAVLSAAANPS